MAKVTINGEVFEWDSSRRPMSEALALEAELQIPYARWEEELKAGYARALCGFIWLVWRRAGREVALADILSGDAEVDIEGFSIEKRDEGEKDPTGRAPEASSMTGGATSGGSLNGSASARGSSGSSNRATSKR